MKLINVFWQERGYDHMNWETSEVPSAIAADTARLMVRMARKNAGVFKLRVKISNHPWK